MSIDFLKFIKEWNKGKQEFTITSSGTTGVPKDFTLKRDLLIYSAQQTFKELNFNNLTKIYNCIPTDKVGGFMNWVRAVQYKLDIQNVQPIANPMVHLSNSHNYTFVSLVPYQLYAILEDKESTEKLNLFETVLLGGAALDVSKYEILNKMKPTFYESYGMTETYSHIGLKEIGGSNIGFKPIGDIQITLGEKTTLQGTITENTPLIINDLLEWNTDKTFNYIGRDDNIINSGGLKINPETVENKIKHNNPQINQEVLIVPKKDEKLGNRIVLLVEGKKELDVSNLDKYEIPKTILYGCIFARNSNQKILRKETMRKNGIQ